MNRSLLSGILAAVLLLLCSVSPTQAQYFKFTNEQGQQFPQKTIDDEVKAILKFFDSIVGGGLYHTAALHDVGGVDLALRGSVAMVPSDFENLPVFSQENLLGLAFLQGSLGLPGNFELMGRFFYFPLGSSADSKIGRLDSRGGVTLIGVGVKYGLLQMPGLPKFTVIGAYHALFVPEEFDFGTVSTGSFKGVVSHALPLFTVFAGGGVDITRLSLKEQFLDGKSFTQALPSLTVGASVSVLPFIHVDASYNFSEFPSFALGAGFSFR